MEIIQLEGILYPTCVQVGEIPSQILDDILEGVSYAQFKRNGSTYTTFPIWHLPQLARIFGPPKRDFGQKMMKAFSVQEAAIEAIKAGNHPLIQQMPQRLYEHQKKALCMTLVCRTFGLFLEQGTGKTLVMLELMRIKSRRVPTLIVCPVTLIQSTWIPEIHHWAPELSYIDLHKYPEDLSRHADIYLLNNQKLVRRPDEYAKELLSKVGRIIIDESSMLKNPESKITGVMSNFFGSIPERYLLTGTPAPNGPHEYWGQMSFLRPGLLPVTYSEYMKTWFTKRHRNAWRIREGCLETIMERISSCSVFMAKKDCLDLPEKNYIVRYVQLGEKIRKAYNQLKYELRQRVYELEDKGKRVGSIFTQIMKLREITSGFIVTGKDKNTKWHRVSNHKFEVLGELLEECGSEQVVVWMHFVKDFHSYFELFPKARERSGFIYGEIKDQEARAETIAMFKARKLQYLFANPASLAHGVTLFGSDYPCAKVIYFDLDYSFERFDQSQDRVHRIGQSRVVDYYAILAEDTIDEEIWARLKEKKEVMGNAMEYLK